MITQNTFNKYLNDFNIKASEEDIKKIFLYLDLVFKYNFRFNITGTRDKEEILKRHILDSLSFFVFFSKYKHSVNSKKQIIDIGTGGGLPGLVLAIFLKNCEFYLLDCKKKIIDFLEIVITELKLKNVKTVHGRAEVIAHEPLFRERFDIVTCRALGSVIFNSELLLPYCTLSGYTIMYKSRKVIAEAEEAEETILNLGGKVNEIIKVEIPELEEYRALLVIKKEFHTLYKYPRKYGKIIKEAKPKT